MSVYDFSHNLSEIILVEKVKKKKKEGKHNGIGNFPNFAVIFRPKLLLYSQELRNFMTSLHFFEKKQIFKN